MSEPSHDLEAEFEALLAKAAAGNARDEERRETLAFATSDQEHWRSMLRTCCWSVI